MNNFNQIVFMPPRTGMSIQVNFQFAKSMINGEHRQNKMYASILSTLPR